MKEIRSFEVTVNLLNGESVKFVKHTKWTMNQLDSWVTRKYRGQAESFHIGLIKIEPMKEFTCNECVASGTEWCKECKPWVHFKCKYVRGRFVKREGGYVQKYKLHKLEVCDKCKGTGEIYIGWEITCDKCQGKGLHRVGASEVGFKLVEFGDGFEDFTLEPCDKCEECEERSICESGGYVDLECDELGGIE